MNRRIAYFLVAAFSAMPAFAVADVQPPQGWTLTETLRYALEKAPEISTARLQRDNADDGVGNAVGRLLPSLDISGSAGVEDRRAAPGPVAGSSTAPWSSGINLALTENLYDNGTSIIGWRQSKVSRELTEVVLRRVRDNLCLAVASAYYRYGLEATLASVRRDQLKLTEKQFATVNQLYKQGLRARRDYLRFEAEVQRTRINLQQAEIAVASSHADLLAAIGRGSGETAVDFAVVEPPLQTDEREDPIVPKAAPEVDGVYAVREASLQARLAPFPADLARRKYWPTVNLTLGASYGSTGFLNNAAPLVDAFNINRDARLGALLTMTFNVWDWGIRRRDVAIADRNVIVADNALSRARLDAAADTKKLVLELEQLKNTYAMSRSLVASQQEIFGFLEQDYREGKVTPVDLIQNFRDLLDARVSVLQARTNLAIGVLRFHFLSANLAPFLGVADSKDI